MRRWLLFAASALAGLMIWRIWQRWQHSPDPFGPGGGFPPAPFPGTPSPAISKAYEQPKERDRLATQHRDARAEQAEADEQQEPALIERAVGEETPPTPAAPPPPAPAHDDDLILIEGIGPKISTILRAAGITSFAQLAEAEIGWLADVLRDAGIVTARPETWPMQAQLAAQGDLAALRELQQRIVHGRLLS